MRVWDIAPAKLCRNHLLGEHREIHAIWSIIIHNKQGYSRHPETVRWKGRLAALYSRHEAVSGEMRNRGYLHMSPLDKNLATGKAVQTGFVDSKEGQAQILKKKGCGCKV